MFLCSKEINYYHYYYIKDRADTNGGQESDAPDPDDKFEDAYY